MPHRRSFVGVLGVGTAAIVCAASVALAPREVGAAPHRVAEHARRTAEATAVDRSRESARERKETTLPSAPQKRHRKTRRGEPREALGSVVEARGAKSTPESTATQVVAKGSSDAPVRAVSDVAPPATGGSSRGVISPTSAVSKTLSEKSSTEVVPADAPRVPRVSTDSLSGVGGSPAPGGSSAAPHAALLPRSDLSGGAAPLRRDSIAEPLVPLGPRVVTVSLDPLVFDHEGDVPRAASALERLKGAFARCATTDTAVLRADASVDLRFLVRAPGRAEGVDVEKIRGVSGDVVRCVSGALSRAYVGAPSDDPVGVSVSIHFRKD